jgi:uncharacterized protein YqkB
MKMVDSIVFSAEDITAKCENITLLFNEKKGKKFISRFSGPLLFADFNKLFTSDNFTIETGQKVYKFSPKTSKSIEKLQNKLFVLFD